MRQLKVSKGKVCTNQIIKQREVDLKSTLRAMVRIFLDIYFLTSKKKPIVFEYIGDDEQRFLICQWILDNVTRFGWGGAGSTPVPASEKKKVWAELWSYSNQQVVRYILHHYI